MKRTGSVAMTVLFSGLQLAAQTPLGVAGANVHLVTDDEAMLEAQIPRKDLPCEVKPVDPNLGYDLRFHGGYDVKIPLKELAGDENRLTMLFRVTPETQPDRRVYFQQNFRVPPHRRKRRRRKQPERHLRCRRRQVSRRLSDERPR